MILKMSAAVLICLLLTWILWRKTKDRKLTIALKIGIGVIFGLFSVLSTHFGIDHYAMIVNVRDLGPMTAGLFFHPVSGIIAGIIGGVERYIAGTRFDIGAFTTVACSYTTIFAGFFAAFLNKIIFRGARPSVTYAFFMGAVIEVFHMYAIFVTHSEDMSYAFNIVRTCALPMILFSGIGLGLAAFLCNGGIKAWRNPFKRLPASKSPVLRSFHFWLFFVMAAVFLISFNFYYALQTRSARQRAHTQMEIAESQVTYNYNMFREKGIDLSDMSYHVEHDGLYIIFDKKGNVLSGIEGDPDSIKPFFDAAKDAKQGKYFTFKGWTEKWLARTRKLSRGEMLLVCIPYDGIFSDRNIRSYETLFSDLLIFAIIFMLVSFLVQRSVINNLEKVNMSLNKITEGDLEEKIDVYTSKEFTSLSNDINETVDVLKSYINAAEKRIEEELLLARTIQESALPKTFNLNNPAFELYATMDPARNVGGDFYDFFFVTAETLVLVIADVSGKGIPASLFMMRSKTALYGLADTGRDPAWIFEKANEELCTGNDANMFVTVWMGLVDLKTGKVRCVNAGHEYPTVSHNGGDYAVFKEKHGPPLGVMDGLVFREYEIGLSPGDCLFLYTDGVPEAVNNDEKQYGTERMLAVLNSEKDSSMQDVLLAVKSDIDSFAGEADQFDDITMLGFRYNG